MQSRPSDLPDAVVAAAASGGWGLPPTTAVYAPVGYGSHHWSLADAAGRQWFASVNVMALDDTEAFDQLAASIKVAVEVREAGLGFAVAPLRRPDGAVLGRLPGGYALAVYPHVEGVSGSFGDALSTAEAIELAGMLCSLHDVPPAAVSGLGVDRLAIPGRVGLEAAIGAAADARPWEGPYGERLHVLLTRRGADVLRVLDEHDRLVAEAGDQTGRLVLTHGEPHPGNVIRTVGGLVLIDWETAQLAPPERDVWMLDARSTGGADVYASCSGRRLDRGLVRRYRLAWAMADLAAFFPLLRDTRAETSDTAWSWEACQGTLHELAGV
jgi:hypothetical protein